MIIVILWIVLASIGLAFDGGNLREALGDLRAARAAQKRGVATRGDSWDQAAGAGVRRTAAGLISMLSFLVVGVVALLWPGRGYGSYVVVAGLFLGVGVRVADAWARWVSRPRLQRTVEAERAAETEHEEETRT